MSETATPPAAAVKPRDTKLGTFAGVFTPSILTILGIILFLRLGFVVGSSGLANALIIIAMANAISVLTSLSVAAIATNLKVRAGGDYYLISRTLGIGFGGALGLLLFMAQSVSVGFYALGFAEAVSALLPEGGPFSAVQPLAAASVLALFLLAWLGADWASKFQYAIMGMIAVALVSFTIGAIDHWDSAVLSANWGAPEGGLPFWVVFAIFFPAVTGFTQGVSMSGDLRSPSKSLPAGTFAAVFLSIVVYLLAAVFFAAAMPGETLRGRYDSMNEIAAFGPLIDIGVIAATLSSALASFLGAPRILQALAADKVFPLLGLFAKGYGPSRNPRRGVLLTLAMALAVIALGNLNAVASVVSMFFLISYGLLNYATFNEANAASPSFRPTFRYYSKWLSLAGALGCIGAMLAIDFMYGLLAGAILFGIYRYLIAKDAPTRWSDGRRSYQLSQARGNLIAASSVPEHPRDWRPYFLVFSVDPERRERILRFTNWAEGNAGLTTVVQVLESTGPQALAEREDACKALEKEIEKYGADAFPLVVSAPDIDSGISAVVQSAGVGPMRANTAIANWIDGLDSSEVTAARTRFVRNLRTAYKLGCNVLVLDADADEWAHLKDLPRKQRIIDIWWQGNANGHLMLVLAYLMTRSHDWEDARIRLIAEPAEHESEEEQKIRLMAWLRAARIEAEPIIAKAPGSEALAEISQDAILVFVPINVPYGRITLPFGGTAANILPRLPITVLTLAAQDVDPLADPEKGEAAKMASDIDRLERAHIRRDRLNARAERLARKAWEARLAYLQARRSKAAQEEIDRLDAELHEAEGAAMRAQHMARRAAWFVTVLEERAQEIGV